jgi:hypothetical protein
MQAVLLSILSQTDGSTDVRTGPIQDTVTSSVLPWLTYPVILRWPAECMKEREDRQQAIAREPNVMVRGQLPQISS